MIETDRLVLRQVSIDDIDIYSELLTQADITQYLPGGEPFSLDYIKQYVPIKIQHWEKGYGTFVVCLRENPSIKIGYAGIEKIPETEFNDIRYAISSKHQGKGYAFEASKAVLDFVFSNSTLNEVYGVSVHENKASLKLLQKLGMQVTINKPYDSSELVTMSIKKRT